jgi:hypothetical protein
MLSSPFRKLPLGPAEAKKGRKSGACLKTVEPLNDLSFVDELCTDCEVGGLVPAIFDGEIKLGDSAGFVTTLEAAELYADSSISDFPGGLAAEWTPELGAVIAASHRATCRQKNRERRNPGR